MLSIESISGNNMEDIIPFSYLNDFIYCPASIYFHQLYGGMDSLLYQENVQIDGTHAHEAIESGRYSSRKNILQAVYAYSEKYGIYGKIDTFNTQTGTLTERKKKIRVIYDGYVFQLYAQYFSMIEMGYNVEKMSLYSMDDNRMYQIKMPCDDGLMFSKFERLIHDIRDFSIENFRQTNINKCRRCIYEPACDRSLL